MDIPTDECVIPCEVYDSETNKTYTLYLNTEDNEKVQTDYDFASRLLESAKKHQQIASTKTYTLTDTYINEAKNSKLSETADILTDNVQKHFWHFRETERLIAAYDDHKDELHHPKKRKYFWDNIENDMLSSGFNVSANICYHKWKNLLRSYKTAKDNKNSSGRGACRFEFFDMMDEILGTAPSNQSAHTLSSLPNVLLPDSKSLSTSSLSTLDDSFLSLSCSDKENSDKIINKINGNKKKSSENIKNLKQKHYDEKMALEKEKIEIQKRKLAIEEEKVKLMKEYIALQKK